MNKDQRKTKFEQEHEPKKPTRIPLRIAFTPEQHIALELLMAEDSQTNKTAFIVYLIAQERKRREEEKNKKGAGRPKGSTNNDPDNWEDEPRVFPHPDQSGPNKGRMLNKTEYDWYVQNHGTHL